LINYQCKYVIWQCIKVVICLRAIRLPAFIFKSSEEHTGGIKTNYHFKLSDMLSVDQTIQSSREIKILLLPIGNISDNKFEEYYNLLKSIKVIELETVTRDLSSKCKLSS